MKSLPEPMIHWFPPISRGLEPNIRTYGYPHTTGTRLAGCLAPSSPRPDKVAAACLSPLAHQRWLTWGPATGNTHARDLGLTTTLIIHLFLAQPPWRREEGRGAKDRMTFSRVPKASHTPPKSLTLTSSLGLICKDLARVKICQAFDKTAAERNRGFTQVTKVRLTFGRCC